MHYKILRSDLTHHGFVYKLGLNKDTWAFNPSGSGEYGGLYYTDLEHVACFLDHGELIAMVTPVGQIYEDPLLSKDKPMRWKTDELFLHSIEPLTEWVKKQNENTLLSIIEDNAKLFKYIENPSLEFTSKAIEKNWQVIKYVENPDEKMQLIAVGKNGSALEYIKDADYNVQLKAVSQDGISIRFVKNPTEEMKLIAVRVYGNSIKYITDPSEEVQLVAVKNNPESIMYILNPAEEVQMYAVQNACYVYKLINNPTDRVTEYVENTKKDSNVIGGIQYRSK